MNDYVGKARNRSQTLLIVEGNHEKNKLFWLLFKCFPEINIDMDNVWIYGTNIYMLYEDIAKEYGNDWIEEEMDIDLPFVISKKKTPNNLRYKDDFINILLVFDYERHDTNFSERKIMGMENRFSDMADMGKLYINYPMIESYQHLSSIPDSGFEDKKIPISLQPGNRYKELVREESVIKEIVEFPHRLDDLLESRYEITNSESRKTCCDRILAFKDTDYVEEQLEEVLQNVIADDKVKTAIYQLKDWIDRVGYASSKKTYWQYMKNLFVEIIYHNICKANHIQSGLYNIESEQYRGCFENLDLEIILEKQNELSRTVPGYIWVLNTSVFVIADYNFGLVQREKSGAIED